MQSLARNREAQVSAGHQRPSIDGTAWHEDGGTLQRFLTSALAGVLTLVFAWQILFGSEKTDEIGKNDDGNATKTIAAGRVSNNSRRCRCTIPTSINQSIAGVADQLAHDNGATCRSSSPPAASQLGAAWYYSLPGNWNQSSVRAPARHQTTTVSLLDMPSRTCEGNDGDVCGQQVSVSSAELGSRSSKWNDEIPLVERHSGGSVDTWTATLGDVESSLLAMSGADSYEEEVPSFRLRPLTWSTSTTSDEEPASPCSCSSDEINLFRALAAKDSAESEDDDDDDRKFVHQYDENDDNDRKFIYDDDDSYRKFIHHDDDYNHRKLIYNDNEDDDIDRKFIHQDDDDNNHRKFSDHDDDDEEFANLPEVTSSTWISLFRTFFMGGAGHQQRSAAARPTMDPLSRRRQERDIHDLLNRTLSTITEEGGDELTRKISELDEDLDDAEETDKQSEREDETISDSIFEEEDDDDDDDDDDDFYSDIITYRFADNVVR